MALTHPTRSESMSSVRSRKSYLSQSDVPRYSLMDAMRIARALADNFGKASTKPLLVAQALGLSPTSSTYRMLCGASIGYGLTDGGYNANAISLTALGLRAVAPQEEGNDHAAMCEAFLRPRIVKEFLTKYHNSKFPPEQIAKNVLESMGVPADASNRAFDVIKKGTNELGLLREIKGQTYVDIETLGISSPNASSNDEQAQSNPALNPRQSLPSAAPGQFTSPDVPRDFTGHRTFAIPLTGGRTGAIQLPVSIDRSDLERLKMWFDVMEDVLIEPEPTAPEITTASNPEVALPLSPQMRTGREE